MEKELSKRIIDELLTYLYSHEITEIRIGVEFAEEGLFIEIQGTTETQPEDLDVLADLLNNPRDPSMEIYYQELLGNPRHDREDYHLLGSLIDDVEIMYAQPIINIKIFRRASPRPLLLTYFTKQLHPPKTAPESSIKNLLLGAVLSLILLIFQSFV